MYWYREMHQNYYFVIIFLWGLMKKARIFMSSLKFPVLHNNTFYHFVLCVTYFSFSLIVFSVVHLSSEFYILMKSLKTYVCLSNLVFKLICLIVSLDNK